MSTHERSHQVMRCSRADHGARRIALEVRRRVELEREHHPTAADRGWSAREVPRKGVARRIAATVAAIVLVVVLSTGLPPRSVVRSELSGSQPGRAVQR
jgi:hypothetical protein